MNKLYVGIDVASLENAVYIMLPNGDKYRSFLIPNNYHGAKMLTARIVEALSNTEFSSVVIGIEATGVYGDNLINHMRQDGALGRFDRRFHVLNPKQVKKFKDAHPDLPKTDAIDAFIIADNLRFGRITTAIYEGNYIFKALQTLTRARFFAAHNLTREKQRFMNYLFMKCCGLAQDEVFSDNCGATALALHEEFETPDDLENMDLAQLTTFIKEKGRGRFANPEEVAKAIKSAARGSYRLPKTVADSVNQVLAVSISSMRAIKAQIKELDKEIQRQFENIPNTLMSIPGIGIVLSAGIIAEIGEITRFKGEASVAKYAGLAWTKHESGKFIGQETRLIKSGNRYLKYYLCEAALSLVRCDTEYRRYYDLKYKEVNKYKHQRALALTARKLVRLIFRLLKDNRLYKPAKA